ncbi:MAG: spore maturation protein [bacterium]|nr:spore maturation protein [bacterium]
MLFIIFYGIINKVDVYDTFIEGVKESFSMIYNLFPTFIGMILAINLFTTSGFLDFIFNFVKPILNEDIIPAEILPLAIIRPISGSASLAYLNNLFTTYGPDSFIGLLGSVIQGCTDTTLYVIGLYFGSIGIKKIRYSLFASLFADLIGIIASIILVNMLFK